MSLKLGLRNRIRRSRAGGFTGLLDQSFASGATAAYSLRKLKSSATKAVRVREDSGNTEIDIGFSGGTLDETALLNHCGSNNGFVTKWYDQSGNANDASNSTASEQPQIVSSGSVIKENGKPALSTDGTNDYLEISSNFSNSDSNYSLFSVRSSNGGGYLLDSEDGRLAFAAGNTSGYYYNGSWKGDGFPADGNQKLTTFVMKSGAEIYVDGSLAQSGLSYTQIPFKTKIKLFVQNSLLGAYFNGKVQEIIFYSKNKNSNRNNIETNINNHYKIF